MQKIASFTVDHDLLEPGIYLSRQDGDVTTYDLRTRKPNAGNYMDNRTMHSVEHMLATFLRNSAIKENIIYFGPMGCQTGFYLLVRNEPKETVLEVLLNCLRGILAYEGPMIGAVRKECGNYQNLSLDDAKAECARYLDVLTHKTNDFTYAK